MLSDVLNLWSRLELIEEINYKYCCDNFNSNFSNPLLAWFYLAKVNICLFFGCLSKEEPDESWIWGFAYFDEEERQDWNVPMGCYDWKEICVPSGLTRWHFGIVDNSNY